MNTVELYNRAGFCSINMDWLKFITRVGDLRVYLALSSYANVGIDDPLRSEIADLAGMSVFAVSRSITNLEKICAIRVFRRSGQRNYYKLSSAPTTVPAK